MLARPGPADGYAVLPFRARLRSIAILSDLGAIAIVAAVTIGVFFGVATTLLRQSIEPGARIRLDASRSLRPATAPDIPAETGGAANDAPAAALTEPAAAQSVEPAQGLRPDGRTANPAPKAAQANLAVIPSVKAPSVARMSDRRLTALLARGDAYLHVGDIGAARRFYERAAIGGNAQAAVRAGASFDPAFLASIGLRRMQSDPARALFWYRRALGLGARNVRPYLNHLETR